METKLSPTQTLTIKPLKIELDFRNHTAGFAYTLELLSNGNSLGSDTVAVVGVPIDNFEELARVASAQLTGYHLTKNNCTPYVEPTRWQLLKARIAQILKR